MQPNPSGARSASGENPEENGTGGNPIQLFAVNSQLTYLLVKVGERLLEDFAMPRILLGGEVVDNSST